jgi:hypothetical protein
MKRLPLSIGLGILVGLSGPVCADDKIAVDELQVVAPESSADMVQDMPMGQSDSGELSLLPGDSGYVDDGLFGSESGGYVHPYLSLEESFTDNVYNVNTGETSSLVTKISPGIWLSLPGKKINPVSLMTSNTAPGGLVMEVDDYGGTDRYQLYALAGADILMYSDDSDLNYENYYLEGLGRYNMASGLSLQLLDRFTLGHDSFSIGNATSDNSREFESNVVMATADWDMTEKFRIRADYSLFSVAYDDSINNFLERQDDILDLYTYYKYSVKTSFFIQYRFTDVEYDTESQSDNSQNSFYGGIRYDTTEKLALAFKLGTQDKQFDNEADGYEDSTGLTMDLQAKYRVTLKTDITLDLFRNNQESDSQDASEMVVLGAQFGYRQEVNEKIALTCKLRYENTDYTQITGGTREDDIYYFRPGAEYLFKEWLMAEAAYSYETRDSSSDIYDYDTNTFYLSLNFAL